MFTWSTAYPAMASIMNSSRTTHNPIYYMGGYYRQQRPTVISHNNTRGAISTKVVDKHDEVKEGAIR